MCRRTRCSPLLLPWAEFRRAKGGLEVHVTLDHADYMPSLVPVAEARRHDVARARKITLAPGSIVAMDGPTTTSVWPKSSCRFEKVIRAASWDGQ